MPHPAPVNRADDFQRFLRDRDFPCLACGYNLRGTDGRRCPECGDRPDPDALLHVGPELGVDPLLRSPASWWACGAVTLAAWWLPADGGGALSTGIGAASLLAMQVWAVDWFAGDESDPGSGGPRPLQRLAAALAAQDRLCRSAPWIAWGAAALGAGRAILL